MIKREYKKEDRDKQEEEGLKMLLSKKRIRMLELLDKQVRSCKKCSLNPNGTAVPHWTPNSRYVIIGEAPGYNEVRNKTPFVGAAGKILTDLLGNIGFRRSEFLIINSVQCRPVEGNRNSKPNETQLRACQDYIRKYINVVNPEKILCLGNYAKYIFTGDITGILRQRGVFKNLSLREKEYPVLFTIHPAYCIYNEEEGVPLLREDIELFKSKKFERISSSWLFTEDEFRI